MLGIYCADKWASFDKFLEQCKSDVNMIVVAFPEVLGDDYLELLVNLSKLAKAGLGLMIAAPAKTIRVSDILDIP